MNEKNVNQWLFYGEDFIGEWSSNFTYFFTIGTV